MRLSVVSPDDLTDDDVTWILDRAGQHLSMGNVPHRTSAIVGLVFLDASLRTRIGFTSACYRLGIQTLNVYERRSSNVSMPESIGDTVRTVSGYADALIIRTDRSADQIAACATVPWLNAGDAGPTCHHPSQALIDRFAMERLAGPIRDLHIAVCGDLRMRAVRSLLSLLTRTPPRHLTLFTDESIGVPTDLATPTPNVKLDGLRGDPDIDVLYVGGIPHGALDEVGRSALRLDRRVLADLRSDAAVLSPMPIIDEVASDVRTDPRMRYHRQSDMALYVRMALIEYLLGEAR